MTVCALISQRHRLSKPPRRSPQRPRTPIQLLPHAPTAIPGLNAPIAIFSTSGQNATTSGPWLIA